MCCRCPPSVSLYSYIYILLTVVVAFYFEHARSIHLTNLKNFTIYRTRECDGFINTNFKLELNVLKKDGVENYPKGNIYYTPDIIEDLKVMLEGTGATEADTSATKTYINNKGFCKIMDNYIYYHIGGSGQRLVSFCPFQAGFYEIYDNNPEFNDVAVPNEMLGHRTFWIELIRHGEKIACKQFQFITRVADNGHWEENHI